VPWPFVRVASHDTASAVAAVGDAPRTAFVSSGTWSLVGVPLRAPITSPDALAAGLHERGGLGGTTLFMRKPDRLWLLEQAARQWREQGTAVTLTDLVSEATAIGPTEPRSTSPPRPPSPPRTSWARSGSCAPTPDRPPRRPRAR
jgi:rhamnulokinase